MIELYAYKKSGRRKKAVLAALGVIMLIVLSGRGTVKVLAANAQSYTLSIEELQKTEPKADYGSVKTSENNSGAIWLAVILLGTGWLLDRVYLSKWEDKYDGRKQKSNS